MPNSPTGTEMRNTSRQSIGARMPPSTSPMNDAADADDVVDAERHAALVGGERVGDDRGGVGEQAGAADALDDAGSTIRYIAPARPFSQSIASSSDAAV